MEIDGFKVTFFDRLPFEIHYIPEDDKERLAFYDKLFYEAYEEKLRLKIWDIGVWMSSKAKGGYCLACKIKKVKHFRDRARKTEPET